MYNVPEYKTTHAEVLAFMHAHPFITLCGVDGENQPVATHIPILIDEEAGKLFLTGHIMRHTDHHKAFEQNNGVLAIFNGPNSYVSASWYTQTQVASTWNYITVHAKGNLHFGNEQMLLQVLERTTNTFEANEDSPAAFRHLPKAYIDNLIKAIVAFRIEITSLEHVFKLSQNKDKVSQHNVMNALENQDHEAAAVAAYMKGSG